MFIDVTPAGTDQLDTEGLLYVKIFENEEALAGTV